VLDDAEGEASGPCPEFLETRGRQDQPTDWRDDVDAPGDKWARHILAVLCGIAIIGIIGLLDEVLPGPDGAQRFYARGVDRYNEYKYDEAMHALDRAIAIDPDFQAAYFLRAGVHRRLAAFDAALADYNSAIRLKPGQPESYYNRALTYLDLGDPDHALPDFGEFVRLKPDDPDGHLRLAETFAAVGDFAHALAERDALVRANPKSANSYVDRAMLRRDFGDLDGALRDIDLAIENGAADADMRVRHGLLWRDKGDLAHARADFEQAMALQPHELPVNDPRPELARGEALRDSGDAEAARAAFEAVIKRLPDYAPAYQQRALLALFAAGDAKAAAQDFATAVEDGFKHRLAMQIFDEGVAVVEGRSGQLQTPAEPPAVAADVPFHPAIDYLLIWRHIARQRAGAPDPDFARDLDRAGRGSWRGKDLAGIPARTDIRRRVDWPYHLVALFAEQATPAAVLAVAAATPGDFARRLRVCEANFYVAEYRLAKSDAAMARKLLQAALDGCPPGAPEVTFARAEMQRTNTPASH
jgi:tetratricopeptide (TPR) repeat protein